MKAGRHDKLSPCHWLCSCDYQIGTSISLVSNKQAAQKLCHDQHTHVHEFSAGDRVLVKDKSDWAPGTIIQRLEPLSYLVKLSNGRTWRHHVELMKLITESDSSTHFYSLLPCPTATSSESAGASETEQSNDTNELSEKPLVEPTSHYPSRAHRPPDRFSDTYMYI